MQFPPSLRQAAPLPAPARGQHSLSVLLLSLVQEPAMLGVQVGRVRSEHLGLRPGDSGEVSEAAAESGQADGRWVAPTSGSAGGTQGPAGAAAEREVERGEPRRRHETRWPETSSARLCPGAAWD